MRQTSPCPHRTRRLWDVSSQDRGLYQPNADFINTLERHTESSIKLRSYVKCWPAERGGQHATACSGWRLSGPGKASRFYGPGGAAGSAETVSGLHGDVPIGGSRHHGRLEPVSGNRSQGFQLFRLRSGEHRPAFDLRATVPTGVDLDTIFRDTLRRYGGSNGGGGTPRIPEGLVGAVPWRQSGVEEQLTFAAELRDGQRPAPPHEHVAVRQHLRVAGRVGVLPLGVSVLAHQRGPHLPLVGIQDDDAGLFYGFREAIVEDCGAVIEDGDGAVGQA